MDAIDPATGAVVATCDEQTSGEVDAALHRAVATFGTWRERPLAERERRLAAAADGLRANRRRYADLMTTAMGKPLTQALAEVDRCAWVCDHYAEHAGAYLAPVTHPSPPGTRVRTVHEPLRPVLAVMPWNFPFWQVFRFAAPYLTAGNVGLLKHASNVPGCALAIEETFREAGYPEGAFQSLLIGSDRVDAVLADGRVAAATLTGSDPAGRAVASTAGANQADRAGTRRERPVRRPRGRRRRRPGPDGRAGADPERRPVVYRRQAGRRRRRGVRRVRGFVAATEAPVVGDPTDEATAVERADDTDVGLGASVWTRDLERGERVARRLHAGCVHVNELVSSDPQVPFGGVGESGYGRELSGLGTREFVNTKPVWLADQPAEDGTVTVERARRPRRTSSSTAWRPRGSTTCSGCRGRSWRTSSSRCAGRRWSSCPSVTSRGRRSWPTCTGDSPARRGSVCRPSVRGRRTCSRASRTPTSTRRR
jgi:succinate-semialdehyde dehydrogenase/glutarate-semialdehyde dehydrogenase